MKPELTDYDVFAMERDFVVRFADTSRTRSCPAILWFTSAMEALEFVGGGEA